MLIFFFLSPFHIFHNFPILEIHSSVSHSEFPPEVSINHPVRFSKKKKKKEHGERSGERVVEG